MADSIIETNVTYNLRLLNWKTIKICFGTHLDMEESLYYNFYSKASN